MFSMEKERFSQALREEPGTVELHSSGECGQAGDAWELPAASSVWPTSLAAGASTEWAPALERFSSARQDCGQGGGASSPSASAASAAASSSAPAAPAAASHSAPVRLAGRQTRLRWLPRAGPENWEAWAQRRGRFKDASELVGRGNASGSHVALRRENCATVVCCRPWCQALVHLHSARRQARSADRNTFAAGDGCAGPGCSINFRRSQFAAAQRRMARALEKKKRFLACWPADLLDGEVRYYPYRFAAAAAAAALARL